MLRRRATQILLYPQNHVSSSSSSSSFLRLYSGKLAPLQERRMIDRMRIWAKGGEGGSGCSSTRRSRTDRHGRPDGGNGGRGGDVILECSSSVWDFSNLQHHLNAKRGGNGTSKNKVGTRGPDKVVQVPVGTVIHVIEGERPVFYSENKPPQPWEIGVDQGSEESERDEIELTRPGERVVVARGGEGGAGSCAEKAPAAGISGAAGTESTLVLELKSIADVGLVGYPNAGKSTLLGSMSKAKPAVGDYPFTTLRPNIGIVGFEDLVTVKVADIPGIIRGAHENRGLGHAFLRHVERTRVLAYVVDVGASSPPWEQLRDLVSELERYREGMVGRPAVVVANKIDLDGAEEVVEELRRRVRGVTVVAVSAVLEEGVEELKAEIRRLVDGGGDGLTEENVAVD